MTDKDIEIDSWRDEPEIQAFVREHLLSVVEALVESYQLDLSRLLGLTVTDRLDEALSNFDDGGIQNGRILTRTKGATVGVAVTPVCKRNAHAYCRIFVRADDVWSMLKNGDKQSRYILAHELGHANDLAQKAKTIEHIALDLPGNEQMPPVFWQIADVVWNEYAACRKSAKEHPEMLMTMYSMLDHSIEALASDVRRLISASRRGAELHELLDIATAAIEPILKHSSHVLGHRASLGKPSLPLPAELEQLLDEYHLRSVFEEEGEILAKMWESHGGWESASIYGPLLDLVRRAYAACGLDIYEEDAKAKVRGLPDVFKRYVSPKFKL
ncbi:MAG: hypothetical protein ROO76_00985 [Terriglobia bacterium]|nr:hypothetical protein [Terriglobia bacterium]